MKTPYIVDLCDCTLVFSEINDISCEVRRRKWNWLGRILGREGGNDCFTALGWTPEDRRARGRPKTTWRRTAEKERNKAGWKSWEIAKAVAQDRKCCQTAWRPYAPTGAIRLDDDDDPSFFTATLYFWV